MVDPTEELEKEYWRLQDEIERQAKLIHFYENSESGQELERLRAENETLWKWIDLEASKILDIEAYVEDGSLPNRGK